MPTQPIVRTLGDTDLYKITMLQAGVHQFPGTSARSTFQCRSKVDLRPYADEIRAELHALSEVSFSPEELGFLGHLRFVKPGLVSYLRNFRLDPALIEVRAGADNLEIEAEGAWADITLFEIHVLEIVAEVYHRNVNPHADMNAAETLLRQKCTRLRDGVAADKIRLPNGQSRPFRLIEFGTRRRFSREWQHRVVGILKEELPEMLWGTSNVHLAMEYGLRPVGTMAHEWLQLGQATDVRLSESQKRALEAWVQEYRGDLGIALTDIFGMDAFLADFDLYFAKLFDGVRHDSGDPFEWTDKVLEHYRKLRIAPETKAAVYSDGLTVEKALLLWDAYEGKIQTSFGIGTHLTCDIPGIQPLNIVMKLIRCNDQPVAKLSDSPGKTICKDQEFLAYLATVIARKIETARSA